MPLQSGYTRKLIGPALMVLLSVHCNFAVAVQYQTSPTAQSASNHQTFGSNNQYALRYVPHRDPDPQPQPWRYKLGYTKIKNKSTWAVYMVPKRPSLGGKKRRRVTPGNRLKISGDCSKEGSERGPIHIHLTGSNRFNFMNTGRPAITATIKKTCKDDKKHHTTKAHLKFTSVKNLLKDADLKYSICAKTKKGNLIIKNCKSL